MSIDLEFVVSGFFVLRSLRKNRAKMDIIKALSSKGSHRNEHHHEFRPDRTEVWSLQYMGSRKRIVNWTELRGEKFKENKTSITKASRNLIHKSVFLKTAIMQSRRVHQGLMVQLKLQHRIFSEEGVLFDRDFPQGLRDFCDFDDAFGDVKLEGSDPLPDESDLNILITQLLSLKAFLY